MSQQNKKTIIDVGEGLITNSLYKEKIIILGEYPFEGNNYIDEIEIVVNRYNDIPINIKFPYSGYQIQLFIGDFTNDNKDNIMIRGSYGGSGGFEIGVIYKYENEKLVEIFSQEKFYNDNLCTAKYKNNYKVSVNCGNKKYLIDLSKKPKDYLDEIYDDKKIIKENINITIDQPSAIFPVKDIYNDYYQLIIQQRIVGTVNIDTLGIIQSYIDLKNSNTSIVYKGLLTLSYEALDNINNNKDFQYKNRKYLDKGSKIISNGISGKGIIYINNNFKMKKGDVNYIINTVHDISDAMLIEGFLINMKTYMINSISNFRLIIKDGKGKIIGEKVFKDIYIEDELRPFESKKVIFKFNSSEYDLINKDTRNLDWSYSYDSRSK